MILLLVFYSVTWSATILKIRIVVRFIAHISWLYFFLPFCYSRLLSRIISFSLHMARDLHIWVTSIFLGSIISILLSRLISSYRLSFIISNLWFWSRSCRWWWLLFFIWTIDLACWAFLIWWKMTNTWIVSINRIIKSPYIRVMFNNLFNFLFSPRLTKWKRSIDRKSVV